MKITLMTHFKPNFESAVNIYLSLLVSLIEEDGNGRYDADEFENLFKKIDISEFEQTVGRCVVGQYENGELEIDEVVNFKDVGFQLNYIRVYSKLANLYFNRGEIKW